MERMQIITANKEDGDDEETEEEMPALVYVAREKRRSWPHHFKAGALNALVIECFYFHQIMQYSNSYE